MAAAIRKNDGTLGRKAKCRSFDSAEVRFAQDDRVFILLKMTVGLKGVGEE
jgi:hypothetical protein